MLDEHESSVLEGTLIYNSDYNCLELNGYELRSDDSIEVAILGSWIPGRIALDHSGWYLVTQDHVGIRLHSGLSARFCEQSAPGSLVIQPEPPPRLLIVDDDVALLQALPRTVSLRMPDAFVETCNSAQAALQKLHTQRYDAIVSDIKMPDIDGLALLEQIKKVQPDTPTLLITGHGEHDLAIRALRGGAYDYILKPVERDSFIAALLRAIQTCRLHRKVEEQQQALELHARSLELTVQQRTQELVEANVIKDKVMSLVSHELKTPLARLKDIAHLLQRKLAGSDVAEIVSQGFIEIDQSIEGLEMLIGELLQTSQIEASIFIPQRQRCNLIDLCQSFFETYIAQHEVLLSKDIQVSCVMVEVGTDQIKQVLNTLLPYAYVHLMPDTSITCTLQQVGREVTLALRDLDLHNSTKLDLYVARKIIERHGGRLEIQSFLANKSTVFITLPLLLDAETSSENEAGPHPRPYAIWTLRKS